MVGEIILEVVVLVCQFLIWYGSPATATATTALVATPTSRQFLIWYGSHLVSNFNCRVFCCASIPYMVRFTSKSGYCSRPSTLKSVLRQSLIWYGSRDEKVFLRRLYNLEKRRQSLIWYGSRVYSFTYGLGRCVPRRRVNPLYGTVHNSVFTASRRL